MIGRFSRGMSTLVSSWMVGRAQIARIPSIKIFDNDIANICDGACNNHINF